MIKQISRRDAPRPRWSTSRPTSGWPTPRPMRTGTATSIMRRSCSSEAVYGLIEVYRDDDQAGAARRQSRLLHHLRRAAAHSAAAGQGDRSRRDRHRCQVGHDRRGQGGQGGDAVLRGVGRLPRLWRRPPPPHGRARPGVLQGRGARGRRQLHAASGADEPRHPVDHLRARLNAAAPRTCTRSLQSPTRRSRSCTCCRSARCRRPGMCAAPT